MNRKDKVVNLVDWMKTNDAKIHRVYAEAQQYDIEHKKHGVLVICSKNNSWRLRTLSKKMAKKCNSIIQINVTKEPLEKLF